MLEELHRFATASQALQRAGELAAAMVSLKSLRPEHLAEIEDLIGGITDEFLAARAELAKATEREQERQRMTGPNPN